MSQATKSKFLLAADIDGTLSPRANHLSPAVRAAVEKALASNIDVFLVTARPLKATLPIHQELGLRTPMVCLNGAIVYAPGSLERLVQHELPRELLGELHALVRSLDPEANFYLRSEDRYAATSADDDVIRSFLQRSGVAPDACTRFEELLGLYAATHRLGIIPSRRGLLSELRQQLASRYAGHVLVAAHDDTFLSVGPAAATKLDAVRYLCRRHGYEQRRVFAAGDGEDDREMLRWSALGVAMGNAPEEVRQAADWVGPRVDEDGFAHAIERFLQHATREARVVEDAGTLVAVPREGFRLRYGANPFLADAGARRSAEGESGPPASLLDAHLLFDDKALSYNNMVDVDATVRALWEFSEPTVVCSKHTHPAFIASAPALPQALEKLVRAGDDSIHGCVLALNRPVDTALLRTLGDAFISVVVAPSVSKEAVAFFEARRQKTQVFLLPALDASLPRGRAPWRERRALWGGELEQEYRPLDQTDVTFSVLGSSSRPVTEAEWADVRFGMKAARYAKTNAAVVVRGLQTLSIANAQTTRYWAVELALQRVRGSREGAVLVCDGRFSHRDAFELAARGGVELIAAPRGLVPEKTLDAWAREERARLVLFSVRLFHA